MKTLSRKYLSKQRKELSSKLLHLSRLYQGVCSDKPLFHGKPAKVYRKCGKAQCRCAEGGDNRHGPYRIIRVFRDKKSTQVTLKQDEAHFYEMANSYQEQVRARKRIIELQKELLAMFDEVIRGRKLWDKKDYKRQ